jgi:hypothetical protein
MDRPSSIKHFELSYLASIVLGLIGAALSWNAAMAQAGDNPAIAQLGPNFLPTMVGGGIVIGIAISLLLWYFAARKAAVVAKWIIVAFFGLGILSRIPALTRGGFAVDPSAIVGVIGFLLSAASVWFLFQPDARAWFGETKAA